MLFDAAGTLLLSQAGDADVVEYNELGAQNTEFGLVGINPFVSNKPSMGTY